MIKGIDISALILIFVNLVAVIGSYFRLRSKIETVDKQIDDIEKTRYREVTALREIYDAKIMDVKNYAKGLYELRELELKDLGKRMSSLEVKFDKQSELLNEKFSQLIKSNALIEAHIKMCPPSKSK